MTPVRIERHGDTWRVVQADRYSNHATWAEMLGQLIALTNPGVTPLLISMHTKAQHEARAARRRTPS